MVFLSLFGQRKLVILAGSSFSKVESTGFLLLCFGVCSGFGGSNLIIFLASLLETALVHVSSTLAFRRFSCSFRRGWEGEGSLLGVGEAVLVTE